MAKEKKKRKVKLRVIFTIVIVTFALGLLGLIYGYIDFEFKKLSEYGVTPLTDWRSYLSFLLSKVPWVNQFVEYVPRKIMAPGTYYTEIYEAYIEKMQKDSRTLEETSSQIAKKQNELDIFEHKLKSLEQELLMKEEKLESELSNWADSQAKLKQLSDWLSNSDSTLIAPALVSNELAVEEIVGALRLLDSAIAADIVGQLGILNPIKAAQILASLAGKEVTK